MPPALSLRSQHGVRTADALRLSACGDYYTRSRAWVKRRNDADRQVNGAPYEVFFHGAATLLVMWLLLFWMYRRKLFLRI